MTTGFPKKKIKWHIIVTHSGRKNSPLTNLSYVIWPTIPGALLPCHCCAIQVPLAGRRGRAPRCGRLGGCLGVQHGGALGSGGAQVCAPGSEGKEWPFELALSLVECWHSQLHSSSIQRFDNLICRTPKPLRISILFNPPPQLIPPLPHRRLAATSASFCSFRWRASRSSWTFRLSSSAALAFSAASWSCIPNPSKGHGMSWVGNIVDPPKLDGVSGWKVGGWWCWCSLSRSCFTNSSACSSFSLASCAARWAKTRKASSLRLRRSSRWKL